ncbi:MAG: DinB family protein [Acidobacteriota bacterium]
MKSSTQLIDALRDKTLEQIERLDSLIVKIPDDKPEWQPVDSTLPLTDLLGHLLECLAGFCAVLYALRPRQLSHFPHLRALPVNQPRKATDARQLMEIYRQHLEQGFALLTDDDLSIKVSTVFVPAGESVLTLLLGNLEHLLNHKYQLFFYLKMLGVAVASQDLYQFRGE